MQYPEYEDLLAESRPKTSHGSIDQDLVFGERDIEAFLRESHEQEQERIETELSQIQRQLKQRTRIHEASVAELEEAIRDETTRLERLHRPFPPIDRVVSQKRQLRTLKETLLETRQAQWQDREQLERERRRLHRELAELRDTELSAFF